MKRTYKIEVDCANCAAKMESNLQKLPGVAAAAVNYMTQKLTLEFTDGADTAAVVQAVIKVCKKVDSDFEIEL